MFRKDFLKLNEIAKTALAETNYRLYSGEDYPDYPHPLPHFVDTTATFIREDYRTYKNQDYQKLGIDIFIYENVPDDDKQYARYMKKAWVLKKLFYIFNTPYARVPFKNKLLSKITQIIIFCLHYITRILPFAQRWMTKYWNKFSEKYYEETTHYALLTTMNVCRYKVTLDDTFPLITMKFEDTEVSLSKDYDAQLRYFFDDYMQLPPPEEQTSHPIYFMDFN
jgi:phosphorylcholine metabolism protein LicD